MLTKYIKGISQHLLVALEQFGDQATNGLLLSALEGYEDSGITQKDTSQNVTINFKYTLFVKMYYMQNDHNKQIWNLKLEYQWLVLAGVPTIKYQLSRWVMGLAID